MKFDQICCYAHTLAHAENIKASFGISKGKWVEDIVTGDVKVWERGKMHEAGVSVGKLLFNYDLGIEFEILQYLAGPHWQTLRSEFQSRKGMISHFGFHLENEEPWPEIDETLLAQEMITTAHTNPFLVFRGRRYHYKIYDLRETTGAYHKFIRRIERSER